MKNRDLWERMIIELKRLGTVRPVLVKGHAGHEANERADVLAVQAAQEDWPEDTIPDEPTQLGLDIS